jgi:hypothetical protein
MKKIKSYLEYLNESNKPPEPNNDDVFIIELDEDELIMFNNEPILTNLVSTQKVTIIDNKLYYNNSDNKTKEILNSFYKLN